VKAVEPTADPAHVEAVSRRVVAPSWVLSIVAHAALLIGFAALTFATVPPRPEAEFTVGIVLKHDTPDGTVFQSDTKTYETKPEPTAETPPFVPESPPKALADALPKLPEFDVSTIGVAGSMLSGAGDLLTIPEAGGPASGITAPTQFFGAQVWGSKFIFAIDCSGSMSAKDGLGAAKRELLTSLDKLPPTVQFQIIFYNLRCSTMPLGGGKLIYATEQNKRATRKHLDTVMPDGGTEHAPPIRMAVDLGADVVFFLTDADQLTARDVTQLTEYNKQKAKASIHTIEFGIGPDLNERTPLRDLADQNRGSYRYVDLNALGQASPAGR
jgi:hypothetical protein